MTVAPPGCGRFLMRFLVAAGTTSRRPHGPAGPARGTVVRGRVRLGGSAAGL
jgi:hypothetical protein